MTQLISKVQYNNFETGEFVDVRERNFDETVALIRDFPWNVQREKITIGLTTPSITIEGNSNDYLKLAPYYNQKYVLYYFNGEQALFTKSFSRLEDGFAFMKRYFEQSPFDPAGFKKETTWFQHNLKHFVTQDFRYFVTPKSARKYLLSTSGLNLFLGIMSIYMIWFMITRTTEYWASVMFLLVMFFGGGGINLVFFFIHWKYAKGKILIMSRGNDTFYYGEIDNPVQYNKKDLSEYVITSPSSGKHPLSDFAVTSLKFKDGSVIQLPSILVDDGAMMNKLYVCKRIDESGLPYL